MDVFKKCTKCLRDLPLESFGKQTGTRDGLKYHCKACVSLKDGSRYEAKSSEIIEKAKSWQKTHGGQHNAAALKYYYSKKARIEAEQFEFGFMSEL